LKAASGADRLNKWQAHFQKLLSNTPNVSDNEIEKIADSPLNIKLGNFTPDELDKVLKNTKNKKSSRTRQHTL